MAAHDPLSDAIEAAFLSMPGLMGFLANAGAETQARVTVGFNELAEAIAVGVYPHLVQSRFPRLDVTTSRDAALTDLNRTLLLTSASPMTYTIQPEASVAFTDGDVLRGFQWGAGQVTFVQGSGVNIRAAESLKTRKQYAPFELTYLGSNEWGLSMDPELAP